MNILGNGEAGQRVGLKWAPVLESSQAGSPPKATSKPCLTHQDPAVEKHPSADTEEETLRRRLEELTRNISGSGTSSEDETKPVGTFLGVSPKVRPQAKHRARGTTPGSHLPLQGGLQALEVELDKTTQVEVGDQPWEFNSSAVACDLLHG